MVVQEPESSPLSKLRHYLNLSDDKDVEISLEDEQSLEDVVLADDRERQMRNNEEALSMAIEKSLSPIQKFADFIVKAEDADWNDYRKTVQERISEIGNSIPRGDELDHFLDVMAETLSPNGLIEQASKNPDERIRLLHRFGIELEGDGQVNTMWDINQKGKGEGNTMFKPVDKDGNPTVEDSFLKHPDGIEAFDNLKRQFPKKKLKEGGEMPFHMGRFVQPMHDALNKTQTSSSSSGPNNRFHNMLRTKKDNIENIVMSNISDEEREEAKDLFDRLAGEGETVTQDHRDAAEQIKENYAHLFEDEDWEVPMSGGGGSTAQENTEANEAERERQKRDGLRRGEVTHNFKGQGNAKGKWNALMSHYSAGDLSAEDVATDLQNYFEENAPADAQARISSGELDAWAKQFEEANDIPKESKMINSKGGYKAKKDRDKVVALKPTQKDQDGDGATSSTDEDEDDPFNISDKNDQDKEDDPDKNESNADVEIETPDGDDGTDYNLNFKGGAANRLMELGLLDADNNPTEAGQKVFNQVSEMAKDAGDIFNSQVISGENGNERKGPFSTFIRAKNANYWGTRKDDYASNWSNASMNHFEAAYNHANPEAPLEPVNEFDADGNLVPIDGAEMNDVPDDIGLNANHIAGAVAAGRAGNNSELAFAHFLNLSDDLEGSHISDMADKLKEHHEANNIQGGTITGGGAAVDPDPDPDPDPE